MAGVAKASKVPIGSLTHRFKLKADLAAAVLDRLEGVLAQDATGALSPKSRAVAEDLRALLATGVEWGSRNGRLVSMLEPFASTTWEGRSTRLIDRLSPVLADWATRCGPAEVATLSPSQLYAVILAPVLSEAKVACEPVEAKSTPRADWLDILARAAMAAIIPPKSVTTSAKARASRAEEQASRQPKFI